MNLSRSGQSGSAGLCFMCRDHSTYAAGAMPMGMPGWPLLARSTPSAEGDRIVLMLSVSMSPLLDGSTLGALLGWLISFLSSYFLHITLVAVAVAAGPS